jgi:hypothetical protein
MTLRVKAEMQKESGGTDPLSPRMITLRLGDRRLKLNRIRRRMEDKYLEKDATHGWNGIVGKEGKDGWLAWLTSLGYAVWMDPAMTGRYRRFGRAVCQDSSKESAEGQVSQSITSLSLMAEPAWQELLRLRLADRNSKESSFAPIIDQCMYLHNHRPLFFLFTNADFLPIPQDRRLAQQTKLLKERNASLLRAVATVKQNPSSSTVFVPGTNEECAPINVFIFPLCLCTPCTETLSDKLTSRLLSPRYPRCAMN